MWRNDMKYKYMFMFPLKNLARKGLISKKFNSQTADPIEAVDTCPTVFTEGPIPALHTCESTELVIYLVVSK